MRNELVPLSYLFARRGTGGGWERVFSYLARGAFTVVPGARREGKANLGRGGGEGPNSFLGKERGRKKWGLSSRQPPFGLATFASVTLHPSHSFLSSPFLKGGAWE